MQTDFGGMDNGAAVSLFTLAHSSGVQASVTNLGATLVSLQVPDSNGSMGEVVLGLPRAEDYLRHAGSYFGATLGRFANRIAGGRFSLDGRGYQLNANNAPGGIPCHLHGGQHGFHRQLWTVEDVKPDAVRFRYRSADGEEGYPGNLSVVATYQVGPGRVLTWTAEATTDAPTIVNVVHHPYWNLSGNGATTIDQHILQLLAESYLPVTEGLIPTGEIRSVAGTLMDFRQPRTVGGEESCDYDHCWVLNRQSAGDDLTLAARLSDPFSGRVLEISTNQPGIQFYDGKYLDGSVTGRTGTPHGPRAGLCLEPQNFPDAPNHPNFPESRLEPGEVYTNIVVYKFAAD
ncbi:MAG: aldose epimerase family protein [Chthoniobacterales bacterium]